MAKAKKTTKKTVKKTAKKATKKKTTAGREYNTQNLTRRGRGRPKGSPNKLSLEMKHLLADAVDQIGGLDRLVEWIKLKPDNEKAFWTTLYPKLINRGVEIEGNIETTNRTITIVAAFPPAKDNPKKRIKAEVKRDELPAPPPDAVGIIDQVVEAVVLEDEDDPPVNESEL